MFHNEQSYNRHNNNSKNSPSMAKSNQMNRNQSSKMESLNHSTIRPFENDDYDYLINCTDLITTCQEALQENNFEHDGDHQTSAAVEQSPSSKQSQMSTANSGIPKANSSGNGVVICLNCDEHSSIRSPSSAASSGLGLSLEEDCSLKYCHSDEEFSSLNSTSAESFSTKALVAEFIEWLDYAENQLDSVCYCAKIATITANTVSPSSSTSSSSTSTLSPDKSTATSQKTDVYVDNDENDVSPRCQLASDRDDNCQQLDSDCFQRVASAIVQSASTSSGDVDSLPQLLPERKYSRVELNPDKIDCEHVQLNDDNDEEQHEDAFHNDEDDEAEELMMSIGSESLPPSLHRNNPPRTKLCLSETVADWSVILARYKAFQNEFEKIGHRFLKEINETYRQNFYTSTVSKLLRQQEERCHNLWIKSLEYLIILQETPGQRCPRHFFATSIARDPAHKSPQAHHHHHNLTAGLHNQRLNHHRSSRSNRPGPLIKTATSGVDVYSGNVGTISLSRSYNSIFASAQQFCSSSYRRALLRNATVVADQQQHHHREPTLFVAIDDVSAAARRNKRVELISTGTGGSCVSIQNRRVQTRSGGTMNESDAIGDTHSLDGSGSPGADSGVFSSSTDKYEIIQKDIGYSSDADMSDAIEAQPHSSDQNSSQRSARKRQVRRRRTRTARPRPWSYHADWTDWDYYQTPFACNGEHASNDDMLNYDNENAIRRLTEFGENYETWINAELDSEDLKLPKPAVVIEKPEIEAFGNEEQQTLLQTVDAATSPIPFLEDKIDATRETDASATAEAAVAIISKATQTALKSVTDSCCMTAPHVGQPSNPCTVTDHQSNGSGALVCESCANSTKSYSSIKFYTSLALAGLFAIFFGLTQFSPEIHKSYSRPPPM